VFTGVFKANAAVQETFEAVEKRRRMPMQKLAKSIITGLMMIVLIFGLSGCKKEGPLEKAGKKVDKAIEKTGEQIEKAGEKAKDAVK
jgi:predicted small lipoprotein YifL